jgi:MFS family permease
MATGSQSPAIVSPARAEPFGGRWLALPVVLIAMFMAQFDLYVVNVSLPLLQHDLHAGQPALQLIVGGYAFMYAAGLITGGRLGDLYGHRRMFILGAVAFAATSLLAGISRSAAELVAFRLLQGLTAAAMVPQVLATISVMFPPGERPRALSWLGVTMGAGAVAGQVLGGVLLDVNLAGLSWRPIFLVNVPIGLIAAWLAARLMPEPEPEPVARPRLDLAGTAGVSGGLALALVPLTLGRSVHWTPWIWACLAVSPLVLAVALGWERRLLHRDGHPFLDLRLFQDRAFNLGVVANVAAFGAFFGLLFTLTLLLQYGFGLSPLRAGLAFAPLGVAFAAASVAARTLAARFGPKVITLGLLIVCLGLISLLAAVHLGGGSARVGDVVGPMAIIGLGNGMSVPSLIGATLAAIRVKQAGAAAGVLTTAQQFASAAGVAGLGSVLFTALGTGTRTGAYAAAVQWPVAASLILAMIAAYVTTRLRPPAAG